MIDEFGLFFCLWGEACEIIADCFRFRSQSKGSLSSGLQKAIELLESKAGSSAIPQRRRSLDDDTKTSIFATPKYVPSNFHSRWS